MSTAGTPLRNDIEQIWRNDHDHFLHPWQIFDSFAKDGSLVMERASGVHVFDAAGRRYLDGIGGLWCVNVGYGREEIVQAIADQARRLAFFNPFVDTTNIPASELAAKLAELAPGDLNHVLFTTGGSTANDSAVRLIHYYQSCRGKPGKRHLIARRDAYHGSTYLTMSLGNKKGDRQPEFQYITDFIHHVSSPNTYRRPRDMDESAFCDFLVDEFERTIVEIGPENVAAFWAEPLQGAGGVIVPPAGYHRRMHEVCRRHDVLWVSDEVVTAFGRLGHMFASREMFGIEPDVICCAKGLTSGYQPLGAAIFSDRIFEVIAEPGHGRCFANGFTYSGHPVACAAALANIDIIEREHLCEHVREVGPHFEQRLRTLGDLPLVGDVRGSHLMMCVEMVADRVTGELFPEAMDIGKRVSDRAEAHGLIVRPIGHLNVLSPPLTITTAQIDELVAILRRSIEEVQETLRAEGVWAG